MDVILNGEANGRLKEKRSRSHQRNSTLDKIKRNYEITIASTMEKVEMNRKLEV